MTKKQEEQEHVKERSEAVRLSSIAKARNAAKAAGAQQVVDLLGNHPAARIARKFVSSLGGVQNDYTGSDPVTEMEGVDEILVYCRGQSGCGYFMGNAPGIRNEIQERINAARRESEFKASRSVSERSSRRTPDHDD